MRRIWLAGIIGVVFMAAWPVPGHAEGWWLWGWGPKKEASGAEAADKPAGVFNFNRPFPASAVKPQMIKTAYGDLDPAYLSATGKRPVTPEDLRKVSLVLRTPALQAAMAMRQARKTASATPKAPAAPVTQTVPPPGAARGQPGGGIYLSPDRPQTPPKVFKDF